MAKWQFSVSCSIHVPNNYIDLSLYETSLHGCYIVILNDLQIARCPLTNIKCTYWYFEQWQWWKVNEGVAGSGKTTLSWHACREWAEKRLLQQFHLFIHIQLSIPKVQEATRLADLIPYNDSKLCTAIASAIVDQKGKGTCFLLDGLDEVPVSCGFLSLFREMIGGKLAGQLPCLSFVMTSRPDSYVTTMLKPILSTSIIIEGLLEQSYMSF